MIIIKFAKAIGLTLLGAMVIFSSCSTAKKTVNNNVPSNVLTDSNNKDMPSGATNDDVNSTATSSPSTDVTHEAISSPSTGVTPKATPTPGSTNPGNGNISTPSSSNTNPTNTNSNSVKPTSVPTQQATPTPVAIDYDQVKDIPYIHYDCDQSFVTIPTMTENLNRIYNKTNISNDQLISLMNDTNRYISRRTIYESEAKNIWVGKYVGNKYKVISLHYFEQDLPDKPVTEPEKVYYERLRSTGFYDYTPTSNVFYDGYNFMGNLDNTVFRASRLVIELEIIK